MPEYNQWLNGIGRSKSDQNGFDNLVHVDIHTEPGIAQLQFALASESATPNEACINVTIPNGDVFFFSTASGKVWKRAISNGAYSLVHTNTNGAHVGAGYFYGYLYYITTTKLGRQAEGVASSEGTWSSQTDTYQTFSNTTSYRPFAVVGIQCFIGNGNVVSSIDGPTDTFQDDALDLTTNYAITTLVDSGVHLLIGTTQGTNGFNCKVFLWDTYSSTWVAEDEVPEPSINCFIKADEVIYAQAGGSGQLYYWTGAQMSKFRKIRGVTTSINAYASTMLNGKPLFATAAKIFSIHREEGGFPVAIVQEYTATTGTIKSMTVTQSILLVSNGSNIDKPGTNYATAVIDTPEAEFKMSPEGAKMRGNFKNVFVDYESVGGTGTVAIATQKDHAGSFTNQTTKQDSTKLRYYFDGGLGTNNDVQARITLTPQTTNNIKIKSINIE